MMQGWGSGPARLKDLGCRVGLALALGGMASPGAQAQDLTQRRPPAKVHHVRTAAMRPLTVHRRAYRPLPGPALAGGGYYEYEAPGLIRRWNDPNLTSFGGWRFGGDNFYGDGAGDPITRGNATLGAISGYGPALGGYGGPHFDSVGGFHNGPGPDAKESADYASGSISQPDYGDAVPHYPSIRQRVATLNAGIPRRPETPPALRAPEAAPTQPAERYAQPDDIVPGLGLGDDFGF